MRTKKDDHNLLLSDFDRIPDVIHRKLLLDFEFPLMRRAERCASLYKPEPIFMMPRQDCNEALSLLNLPESPQEEIFHC